MVENDNLLNDRDNPIADPDKETEAGKSTEADEDVPNKWEGKSKEDVIAAHKELESKLGQQGNELGTLRNQVAENRARLEAVGYGFDDKGNIVKEPEPVRREPMPYISENALVYSNGAINEGAYRREIQRRVEEEGLTENVAAELVNLNVNQQRQSINQERIAALNYPAVKQALIAQHEEYKGLGKEVDKLFGGMPYAERSPELTESFFKMALGGITKKLLAEAEERGFNKAKENLTPGAEYAGKTGAGTGDKLNTPTAQDVADAKEWGISTDKWIARKNHLANAR